MELQDVSEEVEWEARRVAVAFGIQELPAPARSTRVWQEFIGRGEGFSLVVDFGLNEGEQVFQGLFRIALNDGSEGYIELTKEIDPPHWTLNNYWKVRLPTLMARGLYRLGFEDEDILSQLPPLTAHEKLELRLSLPREFWPKRWLEGEEAQATSS